MTKSYKVYFTMSINSFIMNFVRRKQFQNACNRIGLTSGPSVILVEHHGPAISAVLVNAQTDALGIAG